MFDYFFECITAQEVHIYLDPVRMRTVRYCNEIHKKYRILSLGAEKLVHSQAVGGFSAQINGEPNVKLFSGVLDYSLESEKLLDICRNTKKMSRKTYFSKNGYDYTTAIINVKFNYTRHDFVSVGGAYVREGHKVGSYYLSAK